jgi:hypothetical protein
LIARCGHLACRSTQQGPLVEVSVEPVVELPIATAIEPVVGPRRPTVAEVLVGPVGVVVMLWYGKRALASRAPSHE